MMHNYKLFLFFCCFVPFLLQAQSPTDVTYRSDYNSYFEEAYQLYPQIPRGILESVAFVNTRIRHIVAEETAPSCAGLPRYHGVMGLVEDGKGWFRNNLITVSQLSGYSVSDIKKDPRANILAYAKAYQMMMGQMRIASPQPEAHLDVLASLSELPNEGEASTIVPIHSHLYSVLSHVNMPAFQQAYHLPTYRLNLEGAFGKSMYRLVSATQINIEDGTLKDENGEIIHVNAATRMAGCSMPNGPIEYPTAIWNPANSGNYGSYISPSFVAIHTIQGSYAGAISWFQNSISNVSTQYVVRAWDGQVTQMVCHNRKAYHVASQNPYSIGIEHDGYVEDGYAWYTNALYNSSANLTRFICADIGTPTARCYDGARLSGLHHTSSNCNKIKGHQQFPGNNHSDPGPDWDWERFFRLMNPTTPSTYTTCSGTMYDSGGSSGNYGNDEVSTYLISPSTGVTTLTVDFTSWDVEDGWDFVTLYDGEDRGGCVIGEYSGASPGVVTANSGSLFIELRTDCATVGSGWAATWSCSTTSVSCGTPSNLWEDNIYAMGATLRWDDIPNATYYEVDIIGSLDTFPQTYIVTDNALEVHGLKANSPYTWNVRANCSSGASGCNGHSFTTDAPSQPHYGIPQATYTATSCSGTFHDSGGKSGSYGNREEWVFTIAPPNATELEVVFHSFNIEANYDFLWIYDGASTSSSVIGSYTSTGSPGTVNATNGALTFRFVSDVSTIKSGWYATWTCNAPGGGAGTGPGTLATEILVDSTRLAFSSDFQADFIDDDNGGVFVGDAFYQVLEWQGSEWRANTSNGFLYDAFDNTLHSNWTNSNGTWTINGGRLYQSNQSSSNTILSIPVTQSGNERYLLNWKMSMDGTQSSNRRAGIHFMANSGTQSQRGDSHLMWFRLDQGTIEFYNISGNSLTNSLKHTINSVSLNEDQLYDIKVLFDPTSGQTDVYIDDQYMGSHTFASPKSSGSYISLRTGNALVEYEDLRMYRERGSSETIQVGAGNSNDLRFENTNPNQPAGRIAALLHTNDHRWSEIATADINIDMNAPVAQINGNLGDWHTNATGFLMTFADTDNPGMGIDESFYLLNELDGGEWRGIADLGFAYDDFGNNSLHSDWMSSGGSWSESSQRLRQTSTSNTNTILSLPVNQENSFEYLYEWRAKMNTTGDNRRFGLHIMASDPSSSNRGDSYLVWIRNYDSSNDAAELYRTSGNSLGSIVAINNDVSFSPGVWYDFKATCNSFTGEVVFYMDDQELLRWVDPNPHQGGQYVSIRTASCDAEFDDFRVYEERGTSVVHTVGASDEITLQSTNSSNAIQVMAVNKDLAGNWSNVDSDYAKIDYTKPFFGVSPLNVIFSIHQAELEWTTASDFNSGIHHYKYAVGTTHQGSDVIPWTSSGPAGNVLLTGLNLNPNQTYYVSLVAINGAGLASDTTEEIVSQINHFNTGGPFDCGRDVFEPNNDMTTAARVPLIGIHQNARICPSGDEDWYRIEVGMDQPHIRVRLSSLPADYDLELYSSTGFMLVSSTNKGSISDSIIANAILPGTYYVRVWGPDGLFHEDKGYDLTYFSSTDPISPKTTEYVSSFHVYPNPTEGLFFIQTELTVAETVVWELRDIQGRLVRKNAVFGELGQNQWEVNVDDVDAGIYMLEVQIGDKRFVKKLHIM